METTVTLSKRFLTSDVLESNLVLFVPVPLQNPLVGDLRFRLQIDDLKEHYRFTYSSTVLAYNQGAMCSSMI